MTSPHTMQCMEVWGGNRVVDRGVVMAGLDAWVYSRPYGGDTGGGDVHYVSSCASGRIIRLLVADVSGHGDAVSTVANGLRRLMRRFVNYIDQTRFVRAMNEQFRDLAASNCFATSVITTFFAPTRELTVCNAGHPPPLIYRARKRRWEKLELTARRPVGPTSGAEPANLPLGIVDTQYEQFSTRLSVGDIVLCYTDSLIECRDANGELLGVERLLEKVQGLDPNRPEAFISALLANLHAIAPGNLEEDDVTVLLFRANGMGPSTTFLERAFAPIRVGWAVLKSIRPGAEPAPWPEMSLRNVGGAVVPALGGGQDDSDDGD